MTPARTTLAAALLSLSQLSFGLTLEPSAEHAPAWYMALWGESPYAELQRAGYPLPPTQAEVAALPFTTRLQEQSALKAVWLERLVRAREERNRVSRENLSHCAVMAQRMGAPASFVEMLRRQAAGVLPPRERHALDSAQQAVLAAYGVDARELRFFVEGCGLSAEQLRELASWLPLPALFNVPPAVVEGTPSDSLVKNYVALVAARQDYATALRAVTDAESADAAAEALFPVLARHFSAIRELQAASEEELATALTPYATFAAPVNKACTLERARVLEAGFYGSHRLQAVDYLLH